MNIVFLDSMALNPGDLCMESFEKLGQVTYYERTPQSLVVERSKDAEVLVINKVKLTSEIFRQLPKLRMVCVSATGYNVVDLQAANEYHIIVSNAPDYSSQSVAQMVFAHLLNIANCVDAYANNNRKGRWTDSPDFCYQDTTGIELAGKHFGIIGLGNIGVQVARIAQAFGMEVGAVTSKTKEQLPQGICSMSLPELLSWADVVSLHCPQTDSNLHFMNEECLSKMRPGAILINTARGGLVDEQAVSNALQSGKLGAYAADVLEQEPPLSTNPLLKSPRAFLTPHIAWATLEARQRLASICEANIKAYAEGKPINVVN